MNKHDLRHSSAIALFAMLMLFASCVPQKRLQYLQEAESGQTTFPSAVMTGEVRLSPYDLLHIQVYSASADLYQTPGFEVSTNFGTTASIYLQGYTINPNGELELPVLGRFQAGGKTLRELKEELTQSARAHISLDADVVLRLVNFRVSVLGEVAEPGVREVYDHRISVLEAIARSGDLTVYGDRKKVMLVREMNGNKEIITIDLTDRALLSSPYFYLQNNDVLYVPALKAKSYGFAQVQWSVILSSASTLIAILALVTRTKQ
jgi:polysaccharide biosynthesis/export protein